MAGGFGCWLLALTLCCPLAVAALERTALVVGNGTYQAAPLRNPVNDATDVAAVLEKLGFEVILRHDVAQQAFEEAVREFRTRLQRRGGVGLFYYAGHGIQVDGRNYLIPIGADLRSETDVKDKAVDAGFVLEHMDEAKASLNIVILDACRDNPFERSFRTSSRGLAQIEVPGGELGSLLAYSTAPGEVAADGRGRNSPFTKHLLQAMPVPGLSLYQVFQKVRVGVYEETNRRQRPWSSESLLDDFYFRPSGETAAPLPGPAVTPSVPSAMARLTVRSNVYGDTVYIDGQRRGSTRLDVDLEAGWHTVRVEKARYQPYEERIELRAGEAIALRAELRPGVETAAPSTERAPEQKTWTEPTSGMQFVWIPPGCFQMGSPEGEAGRGSDERQHEACVEGFWLGKYEVTNAQYRRFRSGHSSGDYSRHSLDGDDQPVVEVRWKDGVDFAEWLSERSGERLRLPTEAEWEYGARAGTETARYWGEDPAAACAYANVDDETSKRMLNFTGGHACDDGFAVSAPVGRFDSNAFGLHDMLGNVWEWTCSKYDSAYGGEERRCADKAASDLRVIRGGSWDYRPRFVRSANRSWGGPGSRFNFIGFRLARTP